MTTQNFTTYTEVDPNSHITVSAGRVTSTGVADNEDAYVYYDFGAGALATFSHVFTIYVDSAMDAGADAGVWMVSNLVDDWKGIDDASGDAFVLSPNGTTTLYMYQINGGAQTSVSMTIARDTPYYVRVSLTDEGTYGSIWVYVYTDAAMTVLHGVMSANVAGSTKTFRYVFPVVSYNEGFVASFTGYTELMSMLPVESEDLCEGGTPSALSEYSGAYAASKAFDNDYENTWQTANGNATDQWLKYQFASGQVFNGLYIRNYVNYGAKNVIVQGSNNDSDWDQLGTALLANTNSWQGITFVNTTAYTYVRLFITDGYNATNIAVYEVQVTNNPGAPITAARRIFSYIF